MNFKKYINLEYLIIISILILILIFMMYKNFIQIESFGSSTINVDNLAFKSPSLKRWQFGSEDWYQLKQGGFQFPLKDMGINVNNKEISVSFLYCNLKPQPYWRNIFHFTNNARDCCQDGDRMPAMWVNPSGWPNGFTQTGLMVSVSTNDGGNDWGKIYSVNQDLPVGLTVMITLVIKNDNSVTLYVNNIVYAVGNYNNIRQRNNNTILHIGDPWYKQDGNVYVKNFTVYDGALTNNDVLKMYDILDQVGGKGEDGPQGPQGPQGPAGNNGPQGKQGPSGKDGQIGPDGVMGDIGPIGPTGPIGSIVSTGEKTDIKYSAPI